MPTDAQIQKLQSIESALVNRRTKGSIAGLGALFSAVEREINNGCI